MRRYYSKFLRLGTNGFLQKWQIIWQKYFSDDDVDVVKNKFDGMKLSRELDDKTGDCVAIHLYERTSCCTIAWKLISFTPTPANNVHSKV